jgi:hypothetical protein
MEKLRVVATRFLVARYKQDKWKVQQEIQFHKTGNWAFHTSIGMDHRHGFIG